MLWSNIWNAVALIKITLCEYQKEVLPVVPTFCGVLFNCALDPIMFVSSRQSI